MQKNTSEATILAVRKTLNTYKYDAKFMEGIINSFHVKESTPFNMSGKVKFIKRMVTKMQNNDQLEKIEEEMYEKCINELYNFYVFELKNNSRFSSIPENKEDKVVNLSKTLLK